MTEKIADAPALGVSFQHQIDDHRSAVFQLHVDRDCSMTDLTVLLGKVSAASNWLKAQTELPTRRTHLALMHEGLKKATAELFKAQTALSLRHSEWSTAAAVAGRREWRMTAAQKQEETRLQTEIAKHQAQCTAARQEILTDEALIAEMERKVEHRGNGAASPTTGDAGVPAGEVSGAHEPGGAEAQSYPQ